MQRSKQTPEEAASHHLATAEAARDKAAQRVAKLRADLAVAEAHLATAEAEVQTSVDTQKQTLAAVAEQKQKARRWHPPCDATSRAKALGEPEDSPLSRCWPTSAALPLPRPSDWLGKGQPGEKERAGQTVAQFCRPGRSIPSATAHRVYLAPLGSVMGAPPIQTLVEFVYSVWGLDAQPLPKESAIPASAGKALARTRSAAGPSSHGPMLHAQDALDLLHKHKPRDAYVILGYTMEDLLAVAPAGARGDADAADAPTGDGDEPAEADGDAPFGFGDAAETRKKQQQAADAAKGAAGGGAAKAPAFAFGEVHPQRGVGVVSFARFGDGCTLVDLPDAVAFSYICRSVGSHSIFLRRCCAALGHETGRLLGVARSVYGRCLMNGAGCVEEIDARPLLLCPVELRKGAVCASPPANQS